MIQSCYILNEILQKYYKNINFSLHFKKVLTNLRKYKILKIVYKEKGSFWEV